MGKPEGINREAFALLGASHPIVSSQGLEKKKPAPRPGTGSKLVPTWQFKPIRSSARSDGLDLQRWVKGFKDANGRIRDADEGDYYFARFNLKLQMYRYTPEEYERLLAPESGDWSRAETDQLLDMCERFDLRFTVIADRYEFPGGPPRSVEQLKDRYYSLARKLLVSREGGESAVANHTLIRYPYNMAHESERKQGIQLLLSRTPQQIEADNLVMADCKVIEDRRRAAAPPPPPAPPAPSAAPAPYAPGPGAAAPSVAPFSDAPSAAPVVPGGWEQTPAAAAPAQPQDELRHFPNQTDPQLPSLLDMNLNPTKPPQPGVYARSSSTSSTLQAMTASLSAISGPRVLKAAELTLQDLGYGPLAKPGINTRAVCGAWLALRSEVLALHEIKKAGPPRPMALDDKKKASKRR